MSRAFAIAIAALLLAGCTTIVDVKPYKGVGQGGIRYSLPEPYLLVKPKADGTATYEWLMLPNQENEYAIETKSFLSTSTLTVTTENGFVRTLKTTATNSEALKKLSTALGDVAAQKENTKVDAQKAADTAAKADATSYQTKLSDAEKALVAAKIELAGAKAEEEQYNKEKDIKPETLVGARVNVAKRQAVVDELESRLQTLRAAGGAFDAGIAAAKLKELPGPMLFRLIQKDGFVELRAVALQVNVQTSGTPAKAATGDKPPGVTLSVGKAVTQGGATRVEFTSSADIAVTGSTVIDSKTETIKSETKYEKGTDLKSHVLVITPPIAKGKYTAQVNFKPPAGGGDGTGTLSFEVP
jgi:hypothetical protein